MTETSSTPLDCYHCGLPVPSDVYYPVTVDGREQRMCCPGCQAVATAIVDGGLESFYRFRTEANNRPENGEGIEQQQWAVYDLPDIQGEFVTELADDRHQASLLLEGITCAACSWLVEKHLQKSPGLESVRLDVTTHRCVLVWNPQVQPLSELLAALAEIGYTPRPATDEGQQAMMAKENRTALLRLGVAGFGMMQVGMVAVGIYTGATGEWLEVLRWLNLLMAAPVITYSCWPFYIGAWRALKAGGLTMDVPVSLAIILAFIASTWATVFGGGEVYFEAITTFAFFLLAGRYLEMRTRHRNRQGYGNLAQLMPLTARRLTPDGAEDALVPIKSLIAGDRVLIKSGETFPADGRVLGGESAVVEALLTGESRPVVKRVGDTVIGGTLNSDSALEVEVTATGQHTQLSAIERLVTQAADEKPYQVAVADRVARYFVAAVLIVCSAVFAFWWWYEAGRAVWVALSVLVVTCPCALGLAMPTALTAATANLRQQGFLVARGHVIETLTKVNRVIFDKTGTLTKGEFALVATRVLGTRSEAEVRSLAAALESRSNHPLAAAFAPYLGNHVASDTRQVTAQGVEGLIDGERYRLGAAAFASALSTDDETPELPDQTRLWVLLASEQGPLAWFALEDEVRPGARALVSALVEQGVAVELLSGDHSGAVADLAQTLGIPTYTAGAKPDDKLARLKACQAAGDTVLMLGDGINDVPVLSGADVSVAMAAASDLAQTRADAVLLNERMTTIADTLVLARRTKKIIKQNLGLSLLYNLCSLPLASAGLVSPWAAAIGMTASSFVVIFNALRLSRRSVDAPVAAVARVEDDAKLTSEA
ncbi:heavy metal translocating P-type ATPase [Marinimicrobium alkaliphilum]|uniref:heavy metal translocating P-type ATPase n=1 Tax=Marinimicrobium alkaliphilum TaxID=2202654 RepID=UPI000DBA217C|nr:heavy metal translocating P-type ATPase [Marinimicrobium alkaliphilum]